MLGVKKVSVRIDTGLKGEFERVLDGIGLDPTNAMRCFAFHRSSTTFSFGSKSQPPVTWARPERPGVTMVR